MIKMVTRFYYTLKDIFSIKYQTYLDELVDEDDVAINFGKAIQELVRDRDTIATTRWQQLDGTIPNKMFQQFLWPEFQDQVVLYIDVEHNPWEQPEEPDDDDIIEAFRYEAPQWIRWYQETSEKYGTLIGILTGIEAKLMDQLGSENMTLFTDTPQNGSGWLSTQDDFVTNATKVTNKADVATPIARLKEVQDNLRNYYADWADSFSRFVIFSA